MRDRRDNRDRNTDRNQNHRSMWNNPKPASQRRSRRSVSPAMQHRRGRSPDRRNDHHPVHRRPLHHDHSPVHLPRTYHSFSNREYDLPPLNQMHIEYSADLNQEMKHMPQGMGLSNHVSTHNAGFSDRGLSRSHQPVLKQDGMLGGILTSGSHEGDLLRDRNAHMLDPYKEERQRERSLYGRERENPTLPTSSRTERNRESNYIREVPLVGGTVSSPHYTRERETTLTGLVPVPAPLVDRDRESNHYAREPPLSNAMLNSRTTRDGNRDRERNQFTRDTTFSPTIPTARQESEKERNHHTTRDAPLSTLSNAIPTSSRIEREKERTHYARDAPLSPPSNRIPTSSRIEREKERTHYARDTPLSPPSNRIPTSSHQEREITRYARGNLLPNPIQSSHMMPIEGRPPNYPSLYRDHVDEKGSDDLLNRRDRVSDTYNSLVSDEIYKKNPSYPNDYASRHDDFSPRERRVFVDPVHSNYSPRAMHMHARPFDDDDDLASYGSHRDPCMASFRERLGSPIFSERGKTVVHRPEHFHSNHDDYVGNDDYDMPRGRPMGRRHMHMHHTHDFNNDDDYSDGDPYEHIPKRIPVKQRLVEREGRDYRPVRERIRHPLNYKRPSFSRGGKYRGPLDRDANYYHGKNMKKRMRLGPSDESYSYKQTRKYQKRLNENENENENFYGDDLEDQKEENGEKEEDERELISLRRDPAEGSEEFKIEVDKAFMKFAVKINGSLREKRKYLQPGTGNVLCYVCGRESKTFASAHNLVVHSYHTKKSGLRTAHLGLQKALCLLMGWNWLLVPDESRDYQIAPPGEAKVLKQDLLIWPPIVVICNSSVDSKIEKPRVVSVEEIESLLKGIGIEEGKGKVCYGKPANQSVFLVKFEPTLPGYELAKIVHGHFSDKNHGKEHFDQLVKNCSNKEKEGDDSDKEDVLYGYIAGIEDLDKLDGTKVKIKSKRKEIEAVVNAS